MSDRSMQEARGRALSKKLSPQQLELRRAIQRVTDLKQNLAAAQRTLDALHARNHPTPAISPDSCLPKKS